MSKVGGTSDGGKVGAGHELRAEIGQYGPVTYATPALGSECR